MVPSYRSMQFKGKLKNQVLENGEKTNFGTNFDLISPNLGPPNFFEGFTSQVVYIVATYDLLQFQGKRITQTQENDKKPRFGPDLDPLDPNSGRCFFCCFFFFSKI